MRLSVRASMCVCMYVCECLPGCACFSVGKEVIQPKNEGTCHPVLLRKVIYFLLRHNSIHIAILACFVFEVTVK